MVGMLVSLLYSELPLYATHSYRCSTLPLQVLNSTIENPDARIELYRFLSQQEATNEQLASTTRNLGQGTAQLYLTPESVNLNLAQATVTPNGATSSVLLPTTGPGSASTDWQASSGA